MTVREFLRTVWSGKWVVLVGVVVVLAVALVYARGTSASYRATATVVLSSVQAGESTSVTASSDPTIVTSKPVVTAAAAILGDGGQAAGGVGAVGAQYDAATQTMTITADGSSPASSAAAANAFAKAYVDYLPTVVSVQTDRLATQMDAVSAQIRDAQATLRRDRDDPKAKALQSSGTTTLTSLTQQWSALSSLSPPARIDSAAQAGVPLGLGTTTVLALGLLAGLLAGVGLAFARRGLDFRVRTVGQAAELAEAPVLAEVDGVRRALKKEAQHGLPVASRVATPFTESIRELRTAIQVSTATHGGGLVVLVTAADPRAPRSFLAANLAASWALSGRRTVALSGDMRRPQLDGLLPAPEGWAGDDQGLRPTRVPNLELYPVPDQPLDPADYLATAGVRDLVGRLRSQADVVVIDAPPVLAAADATILGSYADGAVLVASIGKTDRVVLSEAADRLRVNHVPLSGLAVMGVTGSRRMTYAATYGEAADDDRSEASPDQQPADGDGTDAGPELAVQVPGEESEQVPASNGEQTPDAEPAPDTGPDAEAGPDAEQVRARESAAPGEPGGASTRRRAVSANQAPAERRTGSVVATTRRRRITPAWTPVQTAADEDEAVEGGAAS